VELTWYEPGVFDLGNGTPSAICIIAASLLRAPQGRDGAPFHILVSARDKTKRSRRSRGPKDKGDLHQ